VVSTTPEDRALPLRRSVLRDLAGRVSVPSYDARRLRPAVLHVGFGRFHRAHQARYFDDLAETRASTRWGVVGAGLDSCATSQGLARQDHLHTVVEAGPAGTTARVVGVMQRHLTAAADRGTLLRLLTGAELQLVTLTVTAEAYAEDVAAREDSVFALLATALEARRRAGIPPFTVLSCDNVACRTANGAAARRAVGAAAYRSGPRLTAWLDEHGAFPSSMADRITPVLDEIDTRSVAAEFGVLDPFAVLAEPYREWVVEDRFSAERPPLDEVGVRFVTDVGPYLAAKTRVVNGAHCAVGYLGMAAGHRTAAAAMADPAISDFVADLLREEVAPGLRRPDGDAYVSETLHRLANPALADPLERLTRRGSVRIPAYVAPALVDALDAGRPAPRLTTVLAGWLHHLRAVGTASEDARAAELFPLAQRADREPGPFLRAVCGLETLAGRPSFLADLRHALLCLETRGVTAAVSRCDEGTLDAVS
jgi:mannitol-1-phosphate/altronate dehydrogenase